MHLSWKRRGGYNLGMNPIIFCLMWACAATDPESRLLNSFETPADIARVRDHSVRLEPVASDATEGRQALRVSFLEAEWPNVQSATPEPEDWSGFGALALDIRNPGAEAIEFGIRVDDDARADGVKFCRSANGKIEPGQSRHFVVPLTDQADPMKYGMRGLPPMAKDAQVLGTSGQDALNMKHIVAWQIFLHKPKQPAVLVLDNVRLLRWEIALDGIVDEFGQYAKGDWPGKLKDAREFAARRTAEAADLKAHPAPAERDKYGGYIPGPALKATGFFRTEKVDGKWWLVTPEGHVFFSTGMDCVNMWHDTVITGREKMFTWLPAEGDALARHSGHAEGLIRGPVKQGRVFNFFACNLERKYGRDYEKVWYDLAGDRLRSWGFNTIANWSDGRLYGNGRMPYTATTDVGGPHRRVSSGEDYWGKMHDPFDPMFRQDVAAGINRLAGRIKDDPFCVGWFVDNELSWGGWGDDGGRYGLALGALAEAGDSPAKQALLTQLKTKYPQVEKLNAAWGTKFAGWDELTKPFKPATPLPAAMKDDLRDFVKEFARQYFRVIREELRKADPNHLYLGCRFAWHTPEAVAACDEISDVVSVNMYTPRMDLDKFPELRTATKPCIIGEFHFGALDRGMFHTGLVSTPDQKARAATYVDYLRSVADEPRFVGCHWFQYVDEPLTGRSFDGENYNIGFLSTTDTPYPEMVEAARMVHGEIYARRLK
jgi:hypothetical protein